MIVRDTSSQRDTFAWRSWTTRFHRKSPQYDERPVNSYKQAVALDHTVEWWNCGRMCVLPGDGEPTLPLRSVGVQMDVVKKPCALLGGPSPSRVDRHRRSVRPHSPEPFITDVLKHARPVRIGLSRPLMNPEPFDSHHRPLWIRHPEQYAISLFVDLQYHIGFQPKSVPQDFRDDNSPRLINFHIHGMHHVI